MLTLGKFSYYFQLIIVDEKQYIAHHLDSPDCFVGFFFSSGTALGVLLLLLFWLYDR